MVDGNGETWSYGYGDPVNPRSRTLVTDPLGRTSTVTYNALGQPLSATDAEQVTTVFTYDAAGIVTSTVAGQGTAVETTTTFVYGDPAHPGDVTATIDGRGKTWATVFDAATGYPVSSMDPEGNVTTTVFNDVGWVTSTVAPAGNVTGAVPEDHRTHFEYNLYGDVTRTANPEDEQTVMTYDGDRNVVTVTDNDGEVTVNTYTDAGEVASTTEASGTAAAKTTSYSYWPDGRLQSWVNDLGATWAYGYDPVGRLATETDPNGNVTSCGYDDNGNLVEAVQPGGDCTVTPAQGCVTYAYDAANQPVGVDYSDPGTPDVTGYTYDDVGRRLSASLSTSQSWSWDWDPLGRLEFTTDGSGRTVGYTWDDTGNLDSVLYPGQTVPVDYSYDDAGRMVAATDWLGNTTNFGYDANSNLAATTFPSSTGNVDTYTYDRANRVESIQWNQGTTTLGSVDYTRHPDGLVSTSVTSGVPAGPGGFGYDARDQLTEVDASSAYSYDVAGNLTARADGHVQVFDPAQQLCWSSPVAVGGTCTTPTAGATGYDYDTRGNRTAETPHRGRELAYTYDQADRLTGVDEGALVSDLSAGWDHSTALGQDGTVWAWGQNTYGQLGDGTTTSTNTPQTVPGLADVTRISAGAYHTIAVTNDGHVHGFGANTVGQVGDGTITNRTSPVTVTGLSGIVEADAGYAHNLALDGDGNVWAWGWNGYGQLGDGTTTTRTTPVQVAGLTDVVAVEASYGTSYAVHADGTVSAWGLNQDGQLGNGTTTNNPTPQTITALTAVASVAGGATHTVAMHRDGTVSSWGDNTYGQLGDGTTAATTPQPVTGLTGVTSINAGAYHTMATTNTGDVTGWGLSFSGQLASGAAAIHFTPTIVPSLHGTSSLGLGYAHTITAGPDGTVVTTGHNDNGQLGDGTTTDSFTPVNPTGNLTLATSPALDVTYTYNPDGQRVSKTGTGLPDTNYTWSAASGLPLLLTETRGGTDTHLIYGPGGTPIAQITGTDVAWYHHDHLGSTRLVTDNTGNPIGTYTYNPYGAPVQSIGAYDPLLDYAGQYTDNETGHQYLRARYYDPHTGQFLTRDPLVSVTQDPYGYAGNDPVNSTDPLGLSKCGDWSLGGIVDCAANPTDIPGGADDYWDESGGRAVTFVDENRDAIGTGLAVIGGVTCVVGTAGTAAVVCVGATSGALGLSLRDAQDDGDWSGFGIDVGLTVLPGASNIGAADEVLKVVLTGVSVATTAILGTLEALDC